MYYKLIKARQGSVLERPTERREAKAGTKRMKDDRISHDSIGRSTRPMSGSASQLQSFIVSHFATSS